MARYWKPRLRVIAALCAAFCGRAQVVLSQPALTVDLRATGTTSGVIVDEKHVLFTGGIGDTVTMDIFGVVSGRVNANPNDDWVDNFHCSFLSSTDDLRGDLRAQLVFDWVDTFGSNGLRQDLDGDGDLDVGNNDDSTLANFFRAFAGQNAPLAPVVRVGALTWTRTDGGSHSTLINARPRNVANGAQWVVDAIAISPINGDFRAGESVQVAVIPEPLSPSLLMQLICAAVFSRPRRERA